MRPCFIDPAGVIFCAPALTRLQAQSFTASLQGNVKDASGAVVPGVTVLLENEATGVRQTGSSNESGHYYFTAVPGSYKLTSEMTGFATVVRAGLGNAPRTLPVRAPTLKNVDASLFRNIYFSSDNKRYAQLRGEAFNLLNTPVFAAPNMSFGSTSFGVISSQANSPRQLQVALKIYF